jgi:hypothetical protein
MNFLVNNSSAMAKKSLRVRDNAVVVATVRHVCRRRRFRPVGGGALLMRAHVSRIYP